MSVNPKKGGPYSLYCDRCHCWVPNTANAEMRKEGVIAYSHSCGNLVNGEILDEAYAKKQEATTPDPVLEKIENMIDNVQRTIDFKERDNEMRMKRLRMLVGQADAESVSGGTLDSTIEEIRIAESQIGAMQDQIGTLQSFSDWYQEYQEEHASKQTSAATYANLIASGMLDGQIAIIFLDDSGDNYHDLFTDDPELGTPIHSVRLYSTPYGFAEGWTRMYKTPDSMWYWCIDNRDGKMTIICSGACDPDDINGMIDYFGEEIDEFRTRRK